MSQAMFTTAVGREQVKWSGPAMRAARPSTAWAIIAVLLMTGGMLLSARTSRLLVYAFPAMSFVLSAYLYRKHSSRYVGVLCWLWFLTPLLRRMVDLRAGWIPATAILLAPLLASCAPALWLVADWQRIFRRASVPLLCVLAACLYATCFGVLNFHPKYVFQDLLSWVAPLIVAVVLYRHREQAPELFHAFETAFLYGTAVVGIYGILQFFLLPKWDVLWMEQMNLESLGIAEPTQVRVFSTMNSPQILASFLAVGLLISFQSKKWIRFVSIPAGLLCLVLSLARSGWVALLAGGIYLIFKLPSRQRTQLLALTVLSGVVLLVALQNPDVERVISQRVSTFSDVRNDTSFKDRVDGYSAVFTSLQDNPFGLGMGATPAVAEDTTGKVGLVHGGRSLILGDSTLITIVTTMGLGGGLLVLLALFAVMSRIFSMEDMDDPNLRICKAILIALLAEALLDAVVAGPTGFLTWAVVGFSLAFGTMRYAPAITRQYR